MTEMIDHLVGFPNENAAHGVLQSLGFSFRNEEDNIVWDRSRVDPGVRLITADAVFDTTVNPPVLITPEETIAGFFISIALPEASDELEGIPGNALRLIENRGLATATSKFHEYAVPTAGLPEGAAANMPASQINRVGGVIENLTFKVSPRSLGSDYPVPF